jgi:hypothetical protein
MKNIIFLPIDIDLSDLNFKQLDNSNKNTKWNDYWDSSFISQDTIKQNKFDQILNQLPFKKITRMFHKIQTLSVESHLDCQLKMIYEDGEYEHLKSIEPGGYRIVLKGNTDVLWVNDNKKWVQIKLPSVPCCYVLNATAGYHKLDADPGRETIYMRGYVDEVKHQELLKRSFEKYKDYAVYFQ